MSFYYNSARQPEILRTVQKDNLYSNNVSQNLSDILRFSSNKYWIKYNNLCKIIGELMYHGFATYENVQTLGEEYTGIIRIDSKYISIPSKLIQFTSILLQFGGEWFFYQLITKLEKDIEQNDDLLPNAKVNILKCCKFMRTAVPYVKAFHYGLFYIKGGKYHISKHLSGINYVLIRHWLGTDYSVLGYKVLGYITLLQLLLVLSNDLRKYFKVKASKSDDMVTRGRSVQKIRTESKGFSGQEDGKKCALCLEDRQFTSCTQCGHLFCWSCIMDWLDQKQECPVCREGLTKSSVVFLQNLY